MTETNEQTEKPSRACVGTNSVTVEHPGTHEPTQAQIQAALAKAGHEGFVVVSGEYVSGGPSTLNVEPAPTEDAPKPAKKAAPKPEGEQA